MSGGRADGNVPAGTNDSGRPHTLFAMSNAHHMQRQVYIDFARFFECVASSSGCVLDVVKACAGLSVEETAMQLLKFLVRTCITDKGNMNYRQVPQLENSILREYANPKSTITALSKKQILMLVCQDKIRLDGVCFSNIASASGLEANVTGEKVSFQGGVEALTDPIESILHQIHVALFSPLYNANHKVTQINDALSINVFSGMKCGIRLVCINQAGDAVDIQECAVKIGLSNFSHFKIFMLLMMLGLPQCAIGKGFKYNPKDVLGKALLGAGHVHFNVVIDMLRPLLNGFKDDPNPKAKMNLFELGDVDPELTRNEASMILGLFVCGWLAKFLPADQKGLVWFYMMAVLDVKTLKSSCLNFEQNDDKAFWFEVRADQLNNDSLTDCGAIAKFLQAFSESTGKSLDEFYKYCGATSLLKQVVRIERDKSHIQSFIQDERLTKGAMRLLGQMQMPQQYESSRDALKASEILLEDNNLVSTLQELLRNTPGPAKRKIADNWRAVAMGVEEAFPQVFKGGGNSVAAETSPVPVASPVEHRSGVLDGVPAHATFINVEKYDDWIARLTTLKGSMDRFLGEEFLDEVINDDNVKEIDTALSESRQLWKTVQEYRSTEHGREFDKHFLDKTGQRFDEWLSDLNQTSLNIKEVIAKHPRKRARP